MLPDSISEEKLKIDWKMEYLQTGHSDLPFFNQFLIFLQKWSQATSAHLSLNAIYEIQNFFQKLDHSGTKNETNFSCH